MAVLDFVGGAFALLASALMIFAAVSDGMGEQGPVLAVIGGVYGVFALVALATSVGLWGLKPYGRLLQIVSSCFGLLGIPLVTLVSIFILIYLRRPGVKLLFSGRSRAELTPEEQLEIERLHGASGVSITLTVLVALLAALALMGFIGATIVIPNVLSARISANESAAVSDVRAVISAEAAYASSNRGFFDRLGCLVAPASCIPNYPAAAPVFIEPQMTVERRRGYKFAFYPGPAPTARIDASATSPSSVSGFAYVARPIVAHRTGRRSFCADASGIICTLPDGEEPQTGVGVCPQSCLAEGRRR